MKEAGLYAGQSVALVGAGGGLGSLACQYAKAMGIHVIAIDGGDDKKASTKKLGADEYVDFLKTKDLVADVKAATPDGLGPHAAILVATSDKPFQQAAEVCVYKLSSRYKIFANNFNSMSGLVV